MQGMKSVLIVDDHPRFRRVARLVLEEEGYEVIGEASDLASGFDRVHDLSPDVVLLDVHLPDGSGFDLAGRLSGERSATRVLMTSSEDGAELDSLARSCGACGFVPKDTLAGVDISRLLS